jgi:hypothetical protein
MAKLQKRLVIGLSDLPQTGCIRAEEAELAYTQLVECLYSNHLEGPNCANCISLEEKMTALAKACNSAGCTEEECIYGDAPDWCLNRGVLDD